MRKFRAIRDRNVATPTWNLHSENANGELFAPLYRLTYAGRWRLKILGPYVDQYEQETLDAMFEKFHPTATIRWVLKRVREYTERKWDMEDEEAAAEQYAENAWLRAAEAPTMADYAFEDWERQRGCYH